MKATFIRNLDGWRGDARLYKLLEPIEYDKPYGENDPPAKKTSYVIVSAVVVMFSGSETYIFPADENGESLDMGELGGSYRGGLSHKLALSNAGYEVEE
jgi:hypothetical protein